MSVKGAHINAGYGLGLADDADDEVHGLYQGGAADLIAIALGSPNARGTSFHEGWHAVKDFFGLVTEQEQAVLEAARSTAVPAAVIGQTGGDRIRLAVAGAVAIDSPVIEAERAWQSAIERYMTRRAAARKQ